MVLFNPYALLSFFFSLPHSFPLISANAPVHNSFAPEVSLQPNCETVAFFLWPANRPFVGCLLRQQHSPFRFCLLAQTVRCQLLLGLLSRILPQEQPVLGLWLLLLLLYMRLLGGGGEEVSHCS